MKIYKNAQDYNCVTKFDNLSHLTSYLIICLDGHYKNILSVAELNALYNFIDSLFSLPHVFYSHTIVGNSTRQYFGLNSGSLHSLYNILSCKTNIILVRDISITNHTSSDTLSISIRYCDMTDSIISNTISEYSNALYRKEIINTFLKENN